MGNAASADYEYCVVCHMKTEVLVHTPIAERAAYYPGVGQLCADCCKRLYGTDDLRTLPQLWEEFGSR